MAEEKKPEKKDVVIEAPTIELEIKSK